MDGAPGFDDVHDIFFFEYVDSILMAHERMSKMETRIARRIAYFRTWTWREFRLVSGTWCRSCDTRANAVPMASRFLKLVRHRIGQDTSTPDRTWTQVQGRYVRDLVIRFFVYQKLTCRSPQLILKNKSAKMLSDMMGKACLGKDMAANNAAEIAERMARWQPRKACRRDPRNFTITYDRSGYVQAVKHWRSGVLSGPPGPSRRILHRPQSLIAHSRQQATCNGCNRSVSCSRAGL